MGFPNLLVVILCIAVSIGCVKALGGSGSGVHTFEARTGFDIPRYHRVLVETDVGKTDTQGAKEWTDLPEKITVTLKARVQVRFLSD